MCFQKRKGTGEWNTESEVLWSVFLRRDSGWKPSWTSVPSTTKERAAVWSHWAPGGWVSPGCWTTARARGHRWTVSWEGRRPRPLCACCRNRGRAMRRTWRRSVVAQRAPIRRWGHLLLPAQQQHCTMETDRSEEMLFFLNKDCSHCMLHGTSMCKRCARLCLKSS